MIALHGLHSGAGLWRLTTRAFYMRMPARRLAWMALLLGGVLLGLTACTLPSQQILTPTLNVTQAYQTVEARLTQAVTPTPALSASPSPVESATPTGTTTPSPSATSTPPPPSPTQAPPLPCDQAAAGNPIDVTIPDDTVMRPGQSFTKIWRLRNIGACPWTREYAAVWFSGEMLSAPSSVSLPAGVAPGEAVEISVDMTAPGRAGTFQSNWKLSNAGGLLFGIGPSGDSAFWVRIIVEEPPTETPPPVTQPSPTPTTSPTPVVLVSGNLDLTPGDAVDLDTLQVNGGEGEDLLYQINENGNALLTPQGGALLGVFGDDPPSPQDCAGASLSNASLPVESLSTGTVLCYLTGQGLYGWARLDALVPDDFTLSVALLTWAAPGS